MLLSRRNDVAYGRLGRNVPCGRGRLGTYFAISDKCEERRAARIFSGRALLVAGLHRMAA